MSDRIQRLAVFLLLFLPACLAAFTDSDEGRGRGGRARLQITYSGSCESVAVYIRVRGGEYRSYGSISRDGVRVFRLPGGRYYHVSLRHGDQHSFKVVYLPRYSERELMFFAPNLAGITVVLRGAYASASLSINGSDYGRVRRGIPRQIKLDPGRRYVIRAYRGDAERVRRISLASRGPRMHRRLVLLLDEP